MSMIKEDFLIRYDCLCCQQYYYVEFVCDGKKTYYCPHCGMKNMNVGKFFASNVFIEQEQMEEWDTSSLTINELIQYLATQYPEGLGEDIFHDMQEALFGGVGIDSIRTYEDNRLIELIQLILHEIKRIKEKDV